MQICYESPGKRLSVTKLCKHIRTTISFCSNTIYHRIDIKFYIRHLEEWCPKDGYLKRNEIVKIASINNIIRILNTIILKHFNTETF